jgi:hypothetical protein
MRALPTKKRAASTSSSDDDETQKTKKARSAPMKVEGDDGALSSSDDDEDEVPRQLVHTFKSDAGAKKRASVSGKQKDVLKSDVQEWVTDSNWRKIRDNSTNARNEARAVYTTSRFKLTGVPLGAMTTLRLAMLYAFRASKSEKAEDAMETVRTLLRACGVKPSETEKQEELLEFMTTKLPKAVPNATKDCRVRVLSVILEEESAFVGGAASMMEAVATFISSGNDKMLSKLLCARKDLLSHADVFEVITQAMEYGTDTMVLNSLIALSGKIGCETRHHTFGSTLLHFVAKRYEGRFVTAVLKHCDAAQKDNKGRTAAYYLKKSGASDERIAELRARLLLEEEKSRGT